MVQSISGVGSSLWMKKGSGLYAPSRRRFSINGLVLYAPLWHPQLSGSPFNAWNIANGGVHSCTVFGAIWGPTGRTFDGIDNKIVVPDHASLHPTTAFTQEIWVYIDPAATYLDGSFAHIFTSGVSTDYGLFWDDRGGALGTNKLQAQLYGGVSGDSFIGGNNDITSAGWYHILQTYDKDLGGTEEHKLIINGVVVATGDFSATMEAGGTTVYLGARPNDTTFAEVIIGEVRIYNRALTLAEIQHIYQSTKWRYQ